MAHVQTQEEWEAEMSEKILSYVRDELYLELRFMDIALSALTPKADVSIQTFATDGTMLFYSTEQVMRVFEQNALFLDRAYLHTVLHCIFSHLWIAGDRNRRLWNLACDIAVEYTIDGMGKNCTRRILSWTRQKLYEELKECRGGVSAAVIYRMLTERFAVLKEQSKERRSAVPLSLHSEQEAQSIRQAASEELAALEREFCTDNHKYWPKREDTAAKSAASQSQKKWEKIARQTRMEQELKGGEPEDGEELLAAQLAAARGRRSYRDFLQKFAVQREELHIDVDEFDLGYYTYGLKLYGNLPLIEPLESRETKKIREFVIVIDTSYSTSGELVEQFLRETADILCQSDSFFADSVIRVLQCDNQVRSDVMISGERELARFLEEFKLLGGGGTDFRPAFSYVEELRKSGEILHLAGLLYFTDGKGIYPKKRPDYKTAFLFLDDYDEQAVPPWALRLRLSEDTFFNSQRAF